MPENLSCPVCSDVSMFLFVVIVPKSFNYLDVIHLL